MDRRLGLACALLSDPHTLVLDEPADALSARESSWLYGMLRAHAAQGGTVLFTTAEPKEAARCADRVVTLEQGRLVADQEAGDFARTRLRPRVAVRSPHANRLAALLAKEARTAHRSVEVVREDGNRLSVYGSTCADVGETAFRHDILVHQLADEIGDMGPGAGTTLRGEVDSVDEPRAPDTPSGVEVPSARTDVPLAELPTRLTDTPPAETPRPSTDTLPAGTPQPRAAEPLADSPQRPTTTLPTAEPPTVEEPEPRPSPTRPTKPTQPLRVPPPQTPGWFPSSTPRRRPTPVPARVPHAPPKPSLLTPCPRSRPPSPSAPPPARCARSATSCVGPPVSVPGF